MNRVKLILAAGILCGTAATAQAAEVYTFSGTASYQADGTNTGGYYSVAFAGPDAPVSGGPGYTYVYDLTGTATFTPYFPSSGNPIVTGTLTGNYTLLLRQDPSAPAYYVDLLDQSANIDWSITGDASDVGQLDLNKPGSATPMTNIIDQAYINFTNGGSAIIEVPTSYLTFTISDALPAPEPAAWALMVIGFGAAGAVMRRQRAMVRAHYG